MESFGSEGEFIRKEYIGKERRRMGNVGDGSKVTWEWIFKIVQVVVVPLLLAVLYQMSAMERRLTVIEAKPSIDISLIQKIAVMEDRQNEVRIQLKENGGKLDRLESMLLNHDDRWDTDRKRR